MSNVLIGIIGVILFIGLALAGALFLGPRFQESSNNSKAAAAIQAVSQVSSAVNMALVQGGATVTPHATSLEGLQTDGYIKSIPANPAGLGVPLLFSSTGGETTDMVIMPVTSEAVCAAAARQSGVGSPYLTTTDGLDELASSDAFPSNPSGCVKIDGQPYVSAGLYVFARV